MIIRATNIRANELIALLVAFYITIGLPLIHPALHESFAHGHHILGHCVDYSQSILEASEDHNCSICDFLATNQLHDTISVPSPYTNELFANIVSFDQTASVKSGLRQDEPRAPPAFIFPH